MNKCMTLTFTKMSETELEASQQREFFLLNKMNIDHVNSYVGKLTIKDVSNPANMMVKWPANIIGDAEFKVVDSDYSSYALIHECQRLWFFSRMSFAILSRENQLDAETMSMLRQKIKDLGVDISPLKTIDHSSCTSGDNSTDDGADQNIFSLLNEEQLKKIENAEDFINEIGWEDDIRWNNTKKDNE